MKQHQKQIGIVVIALAVLAYVANLIIDNPYTHRFLRTAINEQITKKTNLSLDFKALKATVVPPGIEVFGIRVMSADDQHRDLLSASHAEARLSLWSLLTGAPRLGLLEVTDLEVAWPLPAGFPGFLKNPPPVTHQPDAVTWPPAFDLPLSNLVLKNARVFYEYREEASVPNSVEKFSVSTSGLDIDWRISSWSKMQLQVKAQALTVARNSKALIEGAQVDTYMELRGHQLTATTLKVKNETLDLAATLLASLHTLAPQNTLQSIDLNANAVADGDLSLLGAFLDIDDTRGKSHATADLKAQIPIESKIPADFLVSIDGKVEDALLGDIRLHNSAGKLRINSEKILFDDIDIIVGTQSYGHAQGELSFNDAIDFKFTGSPAGLRLMDLLSTFHVDFDVLDIGLTSPDLVVKGRGDPFVLNVEGTTDLTDFTLPATPYDHSKFPRSPSCRMALNLSVTTKALDFAGTQGKCFMDQGKPSAPRPGMLAPPANASGVSDILVSGTIFFDEKRGIALNIAAPSLDASLGEYFAQTHLSGHGKANVAIHGPYSAVLIDVETRLNDVKVHQIPLGTVAGNVTAKEDRVLWTNLSAALPTSGILVSPEGTLFFKDELRIATKINVTQVPPSAMLEVVHAFAPGQNLSFGITRAALEIDGPLLYPLAWHGRVNFELDNATYDSQLIFDKLQAKMLSAKGGWTVEPAQVSLGDLSVNATVNHKRIHPFDEDEAKAASDLWTMLGIHPDDEILLTLKSAPIPKRSGASANIQSDHLQRLPYAGEILQTAGIRGQIALDAKLRGTLEELQGTLEGSLENPAVLDSPMAPLKFRGFLHRTQLDLVLSHSGNALEGRFSADFGKPGLPYEWYLSLKRMDIRAAGTSFFYSDPRNFAYLTADWLMKGKLTDWWHSVGELKVSDLQVRYVRDVAGQVKTLQFKSEQPTTLLLTETGWRLAEDRELFLTGPLVHVRISVPDSKPPENMAFKLDGVIDLAIAREFFAQVESATGKIRINGSITGSTTDPQMAFEISDLKANPFIASTWEPVSLGLADMRPPLRNIRVNARLKNNGLVVESFSANKGIGTIAASGNLNFSDEAGEESRLDITLKDASIVYPVAVLKSFDTTISGNLSIAGRGIPYRVGGDITITKARSTREVDIRDEIINTLRRQSLSTARVTEKPVATLDLNINADKSININNRNIQAILSSSLQITGTDAAPVVGGQVEVVKGKFVYKRDFTVTRGLVIFDDPVRPDPSLDILAVSEVQNYRIYIAITGKASSPMVDFSVDPPTRQNGTPINKMDILVLLSRGSLPDEGRAVGETQNAAAAEALNLLVGQFEEPVEKLFDLSGQKVVRQVYIDTYSSEEGNPIPRFNLPLNLSEDLDVVLRVDRSSLQVSSEYAIHESISLSGGFERKSEEPSTSSKQSSSPVPADTGVDLKFRFAFP